MNTFAEIKEVFCRNQSFLLLSHVRPDGDAIGSQLALGHVLEAMGKEVTYYNEDGLPDNLRFLPNSEKVKQSISEPLVVDVVVALDCATKPRLGSNSLVAAKNAKVWVNIDHHASNPVYGDLNYIDSSSPATGQIVYEFCQAEGLTIPPTSRDAIYVAVSTDTGSFQYSSTTDKTYAMAAELVKQGLEVGKINSLTYDNNPYRRVELLRHLLNTLELSTDGKVAHWKLKKEVQKSLLLQPEDSEGLIDLIRGIEGVQIALFFEELDEDTLRVSLRSKSAAYDVCQVAQVFGGGGHKMAAGIRMETSLEEGSKKVLKEVQSLIEA